MEKKEEELTRDKHRRYGDLPSTYLILSHRLNNRHRTILLRNPHAARTLYPRSSHQS